MTREVILEVTDASVAFPLYSTILRRVKGHIRAVFEATFELTAGHTMGLIGESGCGKSTLGRAIAGLVQLSGGEIAYRGRPVRSRDRDAQRDIHRRIQIIFQNPYASLNPRRTVRQILHEPWEIHKDIVAPKERMSRIDELLGLVGLDPSQADRYPHQFSGGQQQRIAIARALALQPEVIVCDESVSALDVSIQGQILALLNQLKQELGLTYIFITHDLSVLRIIADDIAVMYLGRIVEIGPTDRVLDSPSHHYTSALVASVPVPDPSVARDSRVTLLGEVPSPANPPSGCVFRTRCPRAESVCAEDIPALVMRSDRYYSACHFPLT